jgi:hypothetical protein
MIPPTPLSSGRVCGDRCGGFARTSPIQPYPTGNVSPQLPYTQRETPDLGSVLITRRSGVRIPPPLPNMRAAGGRVTSAALLFWGARLRSGFPSRPDLAHQDRGPLAIGACVAMALSLDTPRSKPSSCVPAARFDDLSPPIGGRPASSALSALGLPSRWVLISSCRSSAPRLRTPTALPAQIWSTIGKSGRR